MNHTPMRFGLRPTSMGPNNIQSLLEVHTPGDGILPALSHQVPTEIGQYIVRCCNSHDALVAACRAACEWIALEHYSEVGKQLRDALAAAGESAEQQEGKETSV